MVKVNLGGLTVSFACLRLLSLLLPLRCTAKPTLGVKGKIPRHKDCWIFHHMVKSGGTTVKGMLKEWAERENIECGFYANAAWLAGGDYARTFLDKGFTLMIGGYTEGLRPYGGSECKWFTLFRHPVERVVSAFFYCKYHIKDPLCAHEFLDAREVDLLAFAQHWGNYGLRQYAMQFMSLEEITSSPAGKGCSSLGNNKCPGWYLVKLHLETQHTKAMPTKGEALSGFLQPAQELLSSNYTAIGILEEFNTSLRLFNRALDLPRLSWPKEFKLDGAANVDTTFQKQKEKMLEEALVDSELQKFLSLDILLYEYALSVYKRQVALLL